MILFGLTRLITRDEEYAAMQTVQRLRGRVHVGRRMLGHDNKGERVRSCALNDLREPAGAVPAER